MTSAKSLNFAGFFFAADGMAGGFAPGAAGGVCAKRLAAEPKLAATTMASHRATIRVEVILLTVFFIVPLCCGFRLETTSLFDG